MTKQEVIIRLQNIMSEAINKWRFVSPTRSTENFLKEKYEVQEAMYDSLLNGVKGYVDELIKELEEEIQNNKE